MAYADGWSIVALARIAGARRIQRSTLTYLAHDLLDHLADRLGRPVGVALLGGPPGVAEKAAASLERDHKLKVVYTADGYAEPAIWEQRLSELRPLEPDVIFVGLGYPREVEWSATYVDSLTSGLVLTAGGFFGYMVGDERIAPRWIRASALEWAWRLSQDPKRLFGRYARGLVNFLRIGAAMAWQRWRPGR